MKSFFAESMAGRGVSGLLILSLLLNGCAHQVVEADHTEAAASAEAQGHSSDAVKDQTKQAEETEEQATAREAKMIAPGFLLEISSLEDRKLNGKYRVEFDGTLKLPYDVTVRAQGHTVKSLREQLAQSYRSFFKAVPSFRVEIVEKTFAVSVNGLVEKPGIYFVRNTSSLDELIASAGGLQKGENKGILARYVRIEQGERNPIAIKVSDYYAGVARGLIPRWKGGDSIFFQNEQADGSIVVESGREEIQLLGEFRNPGDYPYKSGSDFYYYLGKAGGPNDRANLGKVELIRGPSGQRASSFHEVAEVPAPKPGDILLMHPDKATGLERSTPILGIFIALVNSVFVAILAFRK